MGKWPGLGLAIMPQVMFSRGMTTQLSTVETLQMWERVESLLDKISSRRSYILKTMRVEERNSWGAGLVIFTERHRTDTCFGGLKNRYLPMIENLKVETIGYSPTREGYKKLDLSQRLEMQTRTWYEFSSTRCDQDGRALIESLELYKVDEYFSMSTVVSSLVQKLKVDLSEAKKQLHEAATRGLIELKLRTKQRVLRGNTLKICHMPRTAYSVDV